MNTFGSNVLRLSASIVYIWISVSLSTRDDRKFCFGWNRRGSQLVIRLGIVASLVFLVVIKVFSFFIKDKIKLHFFYKVLSSEPLPMPKLCINILLPWAARSLPVNDEMWISWPRKLLWKWKTYQGLKKLCGNPNLKVSTSKIEPKIRAARIFNPVQKYV